jgi:predicted nucleotidyltransferase
MQDKIIKIILAHYAQTQAIYLFGSYGTTDEWPDSDVDIALLLPPEQAKAEKSLLLTAFDHYKTDRGLKCCVKWSNNDKR